MVGIPNAPNALPGARDLLTGGWSVCSSFTPTASGDAGAMTALFVGAIPTSGRALAGDEGMLVRLPGGDTLYLVWHGNRYRINSSAVVLGALAWRQAPQVTVGSAWLNALPGGQVIAPLTQQRRGADFGAIADLPDAKVGQVLVVETAGERQYYLVGEERLRPITAVEARHRAGRPGHPRSVRRRAAAGAATERRCGERGAARRRASDLAGAAPGSTAADRRTGSGGREDMCRVQQRRRRAVGAPRRRSADDTGSTDGEA